MRPVFYLALFWALAQALAAQPIFFSGGPAAGDGVIYRPYYNGRQLVEIALNGRNKAEALHLDAIQPISSIRAVAIGANPMLWRDAEGRILQVFNVPDGQVPDVALLSPDESRSRAQPFLQPDWAKILQEQGLHHGVPDPTRLPLRECPLPYYIVYAAGKGYGIIDTLGNWQVPAAYGDIRHANGHYVLEKDGRSHLLDAALRPLGDMRGTDLRPLPDGRYVARADGRCGIVDAKGQWLLPPRYTAIEARGELYFYYDSAAAEAAKAEVGFHNPGLQWWGILDHSFRELSAPRYFYIEPFAPEGTEPDRYVFLCREGGCGILDLRTGRERSAFAYQEIYPAGSGHFLADRQEGGQRRRLLLDPDFQVLGSGYDWGYSVQGGVAIVGRFVRDRPRGLLLGLMDSKGRMLTGFEYDEIRRFVPNTFSIHRDDKMGLISAEGEPIIPLRYDNFQLEGERVILACYPAIKGEQDGKTVWIPQCERYVFGPDGRLRREE